MQTDKERIASLSEALQDGYMREYNQDEHLAAAEEKIMSLTAEVALLKQKLLRSKSH